jgi:uncharacterized protein (UPF0332 family)
VTKDNCLRNARAEMGAALDALKAADALLGLGVLRDAMSRAYYAAFHSARALLLLEGHEAKTHAGVARLFGDHVIAEGRMDRRHTLVLTRLLAYGQASDYAYSFEVAPEDVRDEVDAAREFVERAKVLVDLTSV